MSAFQKRPRIFPSIVYDTFVEGILLRRLDPIDRTINMMLPIAHSFTLNALYAPWLGGRLYAALTASLLHQ